MIEKFTEMLRQLKEIHDFLGHCAHKKGFNDEVMGGHIIAAQIGITEAVDEIGDMIGDEIAGIEFYGESNFGKTEQKGGKI